MDPGGTPGTGLLPRDKRGVCGGDGRREEQEERAGHGHEKIPSPVPGRDYGSLCSSTRRFCARPAAVLFGATYPDAP